jgi:predicted nucleic acid-binding protein
LTTFSGLYVDTNPLIYAFEGTDSEDNLAIAKLIETLGPTSLVTSELTLSEMLVKPFETNDTERVRRYKALLQQDGNGVIKVQPISTSILIEAAWHRGVQRDLFGQKLKLFDAIHVATATFWGCSHFLSNDTGIKMPDNLIEVKPQRLAIEALLAQLA